MYQRILVPLEREGGPEAHLRHAAELAAEEDAELALLRVVTVVAADEYVLKHIQVEAGSSGARRKSEAEAYVSQLAQQLEAENVRAKPIVLVSDQAEDEAIVAQATEMESDLIVLPNQRRSLLSRWLQGNVAAKVQRRSEVPVLMVREQQEEE
ncbi:MAG: universal stress protein [Anaerolineae bacterium]|jgi:nucleotide-binding universal stress UspA family protein